MARRQSDRVIENRLQETLRARFTDMTVQASRSPRWKRLVLTFRWSGFDELLPEERFQRLLNAIPGPFYVNQLRECVWFELGTGESLEEYMKLPRSEDVEPQAARVLEQLQRVGFFKALGDALGDQPASTCRGDFSVTRELLRSLNFDAESVRRAILVLIGRGVCCDCKVTGELRPVLPKAGRR